MGKNNYKAVFSGFISLEQASAFLDWFEEQGEQDETIGQWLGDDSLLVSCDVIKGKIYRDNEVEYQLEIK